MINWNKSALLNKTTVEELKTWLSNHPCSEKRIVRICNGCNKEKEIYFNDYHDLCVKCSCNTNKGKKDASDRANKRWDDNDQHLKASNNLVVQWKDDEIRKKRIDGMNETRSTPEDMELRREIGRKNADNKNFGKNISNSMLKYRMNQRWNRDVVDGFINGDQIKDFVSYTRNSSDIPEVDLEKWRHDVYKRDNHTCQICGSYNCLIHAHHIKMKSLYPEFALDINNGITMCRDCHIGIRGDEELFVVELQMMIDGVI